MAEKSHERLAPLDAYQIALSGTGPRTPNGSAGAFVSDGATTEALSGAARPQFDSPTRSDSGRRYPYLWSVRSTATWLVVLGALSAVLAIPNDAVAEQPEKLGDGFRVAAGTHLVGPVFPGYRFAPGLTPRLDGLDGWTATLSVETDAVSAANAYAHQAAALGYQQTSYRCERGFDAPGGGFGCNFGFRRDDKRVTGTVRVCGSCSPPISKMELSANTTRDPVITQPVALIPNNAPTAALTAAQRRRSHMLASSGQLTPPDVDSFGLLRGSRTLSPPVSFGYCDGWPGFHVVLRVTGRPDRIWRNYVEQVHSNPPGLEQQAVFRGESVAHYVDTYWGYLTRLDKQDGRTYILVNNCGE